MIVTQSRYRLTIGAALHAGATAVADCSSPPVTVTTASQQTATTPPLPMVSTTTTSTEDTVLIEQPATAVRVHHRHPRYAMHHRPVQDSTSETSVTTDETVTPMATTSTTVKKTETTTR